VIKSRVFVLCTVLYICIREGRKEGKQHQMHVRPWKSVLTGGKEHSLDSGLSLKCLICIYNLDNMLIQVFGRRSCES